MEIQNAEVTSTYTKAGVNEIDYAQLDIQKYSPTEAAIQAWLVSYIAKLLELNPDEVDTTAPFEHYGLDSIDAMDFSANLEKFLNLQLPATLLRDYSNIKTLSLYLAGETDVSQLASELGADNILNNSHTTNTTVVGILPDYYRFDLYPKYRELQQQLAQIKTLGITNPYFTVHERVANDTTQIGERELVNYATYNYLGLSGDPTVSQAAKEAIDRYGTSVSASRIVSGEKPLHRELEREIGDFLGTEDCVIFIGGHATNVTTIGHLFGKNDLILHDSLSHNSILLGCVLSGATALAFPHNDWQALESILHQHRRQYKRVLIVVEGVYSADGDIAPLPELIDVKKRHKAFLMVDEAHSIGVLGKHGRGIGEYFGVNPADVDLWMGTLSKSFASCGGYIAGCKQIIEYLKYTAPGFVYSVGISPPNAAAALAAIRVLKAEPERVARLHSLALLFLKLAQEQKLNTSASKDSPIVPIIIGDSLKSIQLSQALIARGINVQPMIYPSVPQNTARLRFFVSCTHTEEQIRSTVNTLVEELAKIELTDAAIN